MKFFAITPETFAAKDVDHSLNFICRKKVGFLYIRFNMHTEHLQPVLKKIISKDIMPLVPYNRYETYKDLPVGLHIRTSDQDVAFTKQVPPAAVITASSHDAETAVRLLNQNVDYVFISPVFKPLSKQADTRNLLSRSCIQLLVKEYGERIVLLGGMSEEGIAQLENELNNDFSVAGVTMFFGNHP